MRWRDWADVAGLSVTLMMTLLVYSALAQG